MQIRTMDGANPARHMVGSSSSSMRSLNERMTPMAATAKAELAALGMVAQGTEEGDVNALLELFNALLDRQPKSPKDIVDLIKTIKSETGHPNFNSNQEQLEAMAFLRAALASMNPDEIPPGMTDSLLNEAHVQLVCEKIILDKITNRVLFPDEDNGGKKDYDEWF